MGRLERRINEKFQYNSNLIICKMIINEGPHYCHICAFNSETFCPCWCHYSDRKDNSSVNFVFVKNKYKKMKFKLCRD